MDKGPQIGEQKWFGIARGAGKRGTTVVGFWFRTGIQQWVVVRCREPGLKWNQNLTRVFYFGIFSGFRNPQ
jgi:hypothetical protein